MTTKTKRPDLEVDCVATKSAAQARLAAQTRGMTHAEEIAFYEREAATGPLAAFWKRISAKGRAVEGVTSPQRSGSVRGAKTAGGGKVGGSVRRSKRRR